MFEPGAFSVAKRLTNLVYKGAVFAVIGFFAGVAGTSLSNGLLALRKQVRSPPVGSLPASDPPAQRTASTVVARHRRVAAHALAPATCVVNRTDSAQMPVLPRPWVPQFDPNFKLQNEPPHVVWNAVTWGLHMGISSNVRYQSLGGLDAVSCSEHEGPLDRWGDRQLDCLLIHPHPWPANDSPF